MNIQPQAAGAWLYRSAHGYLAQHLAGERPTYAQYNRAAYADDNDEQDGKS